jgi:hypothetical protein
METIQLVQQLVCDVEGHEYLIEVFCRPDGSHFARTVFSSQDIIISDGPGLDEVLIRHRELLPLAVQSRQIHLSSRLIN